MGQVLGCIFRCAKPVATCLTSASVLFQVRKAYGHSPVLCVRESKLLQTTVDHYLSVYIYINVLFKFFQPRFELTLLIYPQGLLLLVNSVHMDFIGKYFSDKLFWCKIFFFRPYLTNFLPVKQPFHVLLRKKNFLPQAPQRTGSTIARSLAYPPR